ncbi:ABC transporter permease [Rugamonas sp. CCM 8940]|uniref:ABC transporter permease n=1 Tax=Rugamonas sp. CCM 8940 TaxID=2765359 RepID=UPI0018F6B6E2|nr:ABC transporter permease [Rugamonas sp. CCM 8940]MBJ7312359.1 ABC transporter permease [Rugamonas sp. CCM 8940]
MKLRDFRMGWRLLTQQPGYSAIMMVGLTIGFAVCFLALSFLKVQTSVDAQVPAISDVYVVKARANWGMAFWSENVPLAMGRSLAGAPSVAVAAVLPYPTSMRVGDVTSAVELTLSDPAFVKVFGVSALEGDLAAALSRPDAIALAVDTARKLFGNTHVVGERVAINGQTFQVVALLPKSAETSSFKVHALAGFNSAAWPEAARQRANDSWNYYSGVAKDAIISSVYARLAPGVNPAELAQRISGDIERSALRGHLGGKELAEVGQKKVLDVALGPLQDAYLDSDTRISRGGKGDPIVNLAMAAVTFLILLLTAGNYVNLATIRTIRRQREIAVRKVLGVRNGRLVGQMLAESVLVAVLAAALGAALAWLLLPALSDMIERDIRAILDLSDYLAFVLVACVMALLVGAAAGLYPAWTALKMRAVDALGGRGNNETAGGLWLRRVLTVVQFAIAMFVTGMIITIGWQIQYLKHIDYGYQIDSLLTIALPDTLTPGEVRSLRDALARAKEIKGVSGSSPMPDEIAFKTLGGESVILNTWRVSPEYFATVGLGAAVGRVFDPAVDARENSDTVVVNAKAARRLGYASAQAAVGQLLDIGGKSKRIVGISKDVGRGFMMGPPSSAVYDIVAAPPELTVNGGNDLVAARGAVEAVWRAHFPNQYLNLHNLRSQLEENAGGPKEIFQTCIIVAVIIVPLAILSIYALSAYAVQRRSREIVMRKLFGASPMDIARLLMREFMILLGVAAVLGIPLAFVVGRIFVEQFAAQAPIGVWAVLATLLGACLVTVIATARHLLSAMRMSPASLLRVA